ncbi:MAG: prepilin-type N-terminal cleavage/methylation domain-containing protein [Gemmatimonadetes bacterium]|nr:prepilin-type N-terminal cleavage/methylation domain-containing protein [Gemmatimonadota bacterium]
MGRAGGFTLIELLIVVAIIAILAAIAVPNFLEAQTRAKVASSKAGLRTLATGVESYVVDHNRHPYAENIGQTPWLPPGGRPRTMPGLHCGGLTSPVAYLTSLPDDPFKHPISGVPVAAPLYYERAGFIIANSTAYDGLTSFYPVRVPADAVGTTRLDGSGADTPVTLESETPARWVLYSLGPDLQFGAPGPIRSRFNINNRYDPTNGTISPGNILRYPGGATFP